jgi:hypothetical protein
VCPLHGYSPTVGGENPGEVAVCEPETLKFKGGQEDASNPNPGGSRAMEVGEVAATRADGEFAASVNLSLGLRRLPPTLSSQSARDVSYNPEHHDSTIE